MIKNKNIFIDTNIVYLLVGYSENKKVNISKIEEIINNNSIFVSIHTIFEMLNNNHFSPKIKEYYELLLQKCSNVNFCSRSDIDKYFDAKKLKDFESLTNEEIETSRIELSNYFSIHYAYDISFTLILAFSPYINFLLQLKGSVRNIERYDECKRLIENISNKLKNEIKNILLHEFKSLSVNKSFCEKEIKKISKRILLNLINSFVPYMNIYIKEIESISSYYEIIKDIKKWNKSINKEKLLENELYNSEDIDNLNYYKKNYSKEIVDYHDKFISNIIVNVQINHPSYDYEKEYIENFIYSMFQGEFAIKSNNIMDKHIVDTFLYSNSIEYFITLDENQIKILNHSNEPRIIESLRLIETLFII
ncbi:MAG: hypothetical protein WC006_06125 [Bacilli bacterium]|nr:hypothetical protein [Bacilli bacterium]